MIGLARYTQSLCRALDALDHPYWISRPYQPWFIKLINRLFAPLGLDVNTFFSTYPLTIKPLRKADLTHLTAQQMAALLWFKPRLRPAVITVHDIVPFLVRADKEQTTFRHPFDGLFDSLAMSGLKKAAALIADSEFTRQTLITNLGCPAQKIVVVPLGVQHETFRPLPVPAEFYRRFGLDPHLRYLLYVGSENPRKNLPRLLDAFQEVHRRFPEVRLIKIGSPEYTIEARRLRSRIKELGLQDHVLFYDHVSDGDLALFYNMADLFVFPSLFEGFGLPPLEAMACGTPVVSSNAASLPEVVGDAALTIDPLNTEELLKALLSLLSDQSLAAKMSEKGLQRAAQFTWERTARETIAVYERVLQAAKSNAGEKGQAIHAR